MAGKRNRYVITHRYMNGAEVTGYQLKNLDSGKVSRYTREQTCYLVGREQVENCSARLYQDKVLLEGIGINLRDLPSIQDTTVDTKNIEVKKLEPEVTAPAKVINPTDFKSLENMNGLNLGELVKEPIADSGVQVAETPVKKPAKRNSVPTLDTSTVGTFNTDKDGFNTFGFPNITSTPKSSKPVEKKVETKNGVRQDRKNMLNSIINPTKPVKPTKSTNTMSPVNPSKLKYDATHAMNDFFRVVDKTIECRHRDIEKSIKNRNDQVIQLEVFVCDGNIRYDLRTWFINLEINITTNKAEVYLVSKDIDTELCKTKINGVTKENIIWLANTFLDKVTDKCDI